MQNRFQVWQADIGIFKGALLRWLQQERLSGTAGSQHAKGDSYKMTNSKKMLSLALAGTLALSLAACGSGTASSVSGNTTDSTETSAADYTIQPELDSSVDYTQGNSYSLIIATDGAEDRVDALLVHYIADELSYITGGRIQLQSYFNGSMGTDSELCESAQAGDVAFFLGSTAFTASFVPELSVIDLPFLYSDVQQFRSTMDDETILNYYSEKYSENGLELIGFFDQGMRQMTSNTRVQSLDDLKGQKIRVMENKTHIAIWQALGANPTPMAFSEVYMALQQGTIDAQENPFEVIYANRLYEQQDYVILTNHLPAAHNLVVSQVVYNGMTESDQALIMAVGKAAIQYSREQCDERLADRMQLVADTGTEIVELSDEALQAMRDACSGVYDDIRGEFGDEQVDMQINAANRYAD